MENLKIAAAYIRVSTHDQEEYSPESQIKLIRDYAKITALSCRKNLFSEMMVSVAEERI